METSISSDSDLSLLAKLEALLFVSPGMVSPGQLASALEMSVTEVESGLRALEDRYSRDGKNYGLRLQKHKDRYQLTTAPQATPAVERLLGLEASSHLSR